MRLRSETLAATEANHYATAAVRLDRIEGRLDRIEKRLGLFDSVPPTE